MRVLSKIYTYEYIHRLFPSDGTVGTVCDIAMTYIGNRLTKAVDSADPVTLESSLDFPSDYAWFGYNADGNQYGYLARYYRNKLQSRGQAN